MEEKYRIYTRVASITTFGVALIFIAAYIYQIQFGNSPFAPTEKTADEDSFFIMEEAVQNQILTTFDYVSGLGVVANTFPNRFEISDSGDGLTVAVKDADGNTIANIFEFVLPEDATIADVAATVKDNLANFTLEPIADAYPDAFAFLDGDSLTAVLPLPDRILAFETDNENYAFTQKLITALFGISNVVENPFQSVEEIQ